MTREPGGTRVQCVGWQDRDYARFTSAERERFFGSGSVTRRSATRSRSSSWLLLLAAVSLAGMFVLPHVAIHGHHYRLFIL